PFRPDPGPQPRPPAVQAPPAVRRRLVELDAAVTAEGGCAGEGGGGRGGPRRTPFSQGGVVPHFRVGLDAAGVPGRSGGLAASRPTGGGGVPPSARAGFTEGEWGSRGRDGAVSRPRRRCPGCAGPPPSAPAAPRGTAPTRGSRVRPGRSWRCGPGRGRRARRRGPRRGGRRRRRGGPTSDRRPGAGARPRAAAGRSPATGGRRRRCGGRPRSASSRAVLAQPVVFVLQVEDAGDPGEVDALLGQLGDPAEPADVLVAVHAGAALGPGRGEQALLLVEAERGRRCADQPGGHRDGVDGLVGERARVLGHYGLPGGGARCAPGDLRSPMKVSFLLDDVYSPESVVENLSESASGSLGSAMMEVTGMLMRTDPFREFDRLAQRVFSEARPA